MEVWTHRPQGNVIESLEWLTDIIACRSAEQRFRMRLLPRQMFTFAHQMDTQEYGRALQKARNVGGDPLYVPDWLCLVEKGAINVGTVSLALDTSHMPAYKAGGHVLLWEAFDHFEVCSISAIADGALTISATTKSYTRPTVVPLRVGTFAQPFSGSRPPARYNTAQVVFVVTATEDMVDAAATLYQTYAGYPLVTSSREEIHSAEDTAAREVSTLDSSVGGLVNYPVRSFPATSMSVAITAQTPAELINLRSFFASLCGMWKAFWLPSQNIDFVLTKDVEAGDTFIQIEAVDYATNYRYYSHVAIVTVMGYAIPLQVTRVSTEVSGSERLHCASAVLYGGGVLGRESVDRVCLLTLSRLAADRIEFQSLPGLAAAVVAPTVEVPG